MQEIVDLGSLMPAEKFVRIGDEVFCCTEASSASAVEYRNTTTASAQISDGKLTGFKSLHNAEPLLVSLNIYRTTKTPEGVYTRAKDKDGVPRPIGLVAISGWTNRVVSELFDIIKELSPKLMGKPTLESLNAQIEKLTQQRDLLLESQNNKEKEENPTNTTEGTSA